MTEHLLGTLAVVGPIAGFVVGAAVGTARKQLVPLAAKGYLIGCVGLASYMWWTTHQWKPHYEKHVRTPVSWKKDQPKDMVELIDADTAEAVMTTGVRMAGIAAIILWFALSMGAWKWRGQVRSHQPTLFAAIAIIIVRGLWSAYNWHCRYDPVTDYFGLEKVRVLGVNFVMFIATGVAMGILWTLMTSKPTVVRSNGGSVVDGQTAVPEPPNNRTPKPPRS